MMLLYHFIASTLHKKHVYRLYCAKFKVPKKMLISPGKLYLGFPIIS